MVVVALVVVVAMVAMVMVMVMLVVLVVVVAMVAMVMVMVMVVLVVVVAMVAMVMVMVTVMVMVMVMVMVVVMIVVVAVALVVVVVMVAMVPAPFLNDDPELTGAVHAGGVLEGAEGLLAHAVEVIVDHIEDVAVNARQQLRRRRRLKGEDGRDASGALGVVARHGGLEDAPVAPALGLVLEEVAVVLHVPVEEEGVLEERLPGRALHGALNHSRILRAVAALEGLHHLLIGLANAAVDGPVVPTDLLGAPEERVLRVGVVRAAPRPHCGRGVPGALVTVGRGLNEAHHKL